MTDTPRTFALTRDLDEPNRIVGYGMELPDGTAVSVNWPTTRATSLYLTSSAQEVADLRGAEVLWIDEQP